MRRLRLLALWLWLLLAAINEWNKPESAKWTGTTNWTLGHKPESTEEVTLTSAHNGEVKVEGSIAKCLSLVAVGYSGNFNLQVTLEIGGATAQTENYALRLGEATTFNSSGGAPSLKFISTVTATAQKIDFAGKSIGATPISFTTKGKWIFVSVVKATGETAAISVEVGTLETNGQTIEAARVTTSSGATLDITGSTLKLSKATSAAWTCSTTATLTTTGSTIELTGESGIFEGGTKSYATFVSAAANQSITEANSFSLVRVNNKGAAAGKGLKLPKGVTQKVASISFSGTAGEPSRLESSEAGQQATIELTGSDVEATGYGVVKDLKVTGKTLYLPNGTDGGNNSGIVFHARVIEASDTVAVSTSVSRTVALSRTTGDTVAVSESPARIAAFTRTAADTAAVSDAVARGAFAASRSSADTVGVSDAAVRGLAQARTAGDTVAVSDSAARAGGGGITRTASDTVTVSDSTARTVVSARAIADTVTLGTAVSRVSSSPRTATDIVVVSDAATRSTTRARTAGDTVTLTTATARSIALNRAGADTVTVSTTAVRATTRARTVTDTVTVFDAVVAFIKTALPLQMNFTSDGAIAMHVTSGPAVAMTLTTER